MLEHRDTSIEFEFSLQNYRSFIAEPARVDVRPGFSAFIGLNNAGKSSFLRSLWELRSLIACIGHGLQNDDKNVQLLLEGNAVNLLTLGGALQMLDGERPFPSENERPVTLAFKFANSAPTVSEQFHAVVGATIRLSQGFEVTCEIDLSDGTSAASKGKCSSRDEETFHIRTGDFVVESSGEHIDLLPFIKALDLLEGAHYIGPFRNVLPYGGNDRYYDVEIGKNFVQNLSRVLTTEVDAKKRDAILRMQQEIRKVFELGEFGLTASADGESLTANVDGTSFRITEQGGGLAHFIVTAANIVINRPLMLLIDEPELNLHPKLQVDFMLLLSSYVEGPIWFATHSLGLARTIGDQKYCVWKDEQRVSHLRRYEEAPNLTAMLGQMGYLTNDALGYVAVLLVEGPTDVRVFQRFLSLYGKEHRVVVLPLGGDDRINGDVATELEEVRRLSSNVYAVVDSERVAADAPALSNRIAFKKACDELGFKCLVTERRATENYLAARALKQIYGPKTQNLGHFDRARACQELCVSSGMVS